MWVNCGSGRFALSANKLILIDTLGAFLSASMLGLVLPAFNHFIGLPVEKLYFFAFLACGILIQSCVRYFFFKMNTKDWLLNLIVLNGLYCFVTIVILAKNLHSLRVLGWLYFIGEISIILFLLTLEIKAFKRAN